MGRKRDEEHDEEKILRWRAGKVAKRSLAADLQDDLSSYNDNLWTESMGGIESVNREEAGLVEALLTYQSSAPIPKGKKWLHGSSEDEYEDEYYSKQKNWLTKGQILLVGQITAQGTKVNLWENLVAKLGFLSFVVPNSKYLALFVNLILTLEHAPLSQSVFLLPWFWPKSHGITWLNLKYYVIWPSTVYETLSVQLQPPQMCLVKHSEKGLLSP